MFTDKILKKVALHGLTVGEHCVNFLKKNNFPFNNLTLNDNEKMERNVHEELGLESRFKQGFFPYPVKSQKNSFPPMRCYSNCDLN